MIRRDRTRLRAVDQGVDVGAPGDVDALGPEPYALRGDLVRRSPARRLVDVAPTIVAAGRPEHARGCLADPARNAVSTATCPDKSNSSCTGVT